MVVGTILRWRRQWRKRSLRRLGPTSRGGKIQSHSILQRDRSWTSMSGLIECQGCGCIGSGGSRTDWTWRGLRINKWLSRTERRRKARRRDWHRKRGRARNEGGEY